MGAGPNGLVAALDLARAGLAVDVVRGGGRTGRRVPNRGADPARVTTTTSARRSTRCWWPRPPSATSTCRPTECGSRPRRSPSPIRSTAGAPSASAAASSEVAASLGAGRRGLRAHLRAPRPRPGQDPARLPRLDALTPGAPAGRRRLRRCAGSPRPGTWPGAFDTEEGRALVAGTAAHSMLPLTAPLSGVFPRLFTALAHRYGWPVVEGGSGAVVDALVSELSARGGRIETGRLVKRLDDLPPAAGGRARRDPAPARSRWRATPCRPRTAGPSPAIATGPGCARWTGRCSGPVPWRAEGCRQTVTVHVGGTFEEIARSEADVNAGRHPDRPYCLVTQPCVVDPRRAPEGRHTLWAYCHVPNGSAVDMTAADRGADRAVRARLPRPDPRPVDLHRRGRGGAQSELRGRRHQRGRRHAPADGLPADRAVEPLPHRHEGRLPLLGRHPARWWRARHVRARGGPCRPPRSGEKEAAPPVP